MRRGPKAGRLETEFGAVFETVLLREWIMSTGRCGFMDKIRILLVGDHTLFRQGLKTSISAESDMDLAGEASNGADAIEKADEVRPDVVLMDISMPDLSSFEAARQIRKNRPNAGVLFLTTYADPDDLRQAMALGASGYVFKDSSSAALMTAVREVYRG